jgi:hypothetical protein
MAALEETPPVVELDHSLMRWPSEDLHDDDFDTITKKIDHPHIEQVWIGSDFPDDEEETKGAEACDTDSDEEKKEKVKLQPPPVLLHREYASKQMGWFHSPQPRVYELWSDHKLKCFSKKDGVEIETIILSEVGLITQKGHKLKLHLEDPLLKGRDNRPYGHWDLKHVILCKDIDAATAFKRKVYQESIHLHFGDE